MLVAALPTGGEPGRQQGLKNLSVGCFPAMTKPGDYVTFKVSAPDRNGASWFVFFCPGCNEPHAVPVTGPKAWGFDQNYEAPTLTPSLLRRGGSADLTCHTFVERGQIRFLGDCSHRMANRTVALPELPNWMR